IEFADRSTLLNFVTYPLTNNTCYNVRVRVSFDGGNTFCPFGPYCTITIGTAVCAPAMPLAPDDAADYASESKLTIWPNPNDGSLVNISFTDIDVDVNTVGVDVMDAVGRVVTTRTLPVQDGVVRSTMSFDETLAPGLYVVNLQAGDRRWTERLVIQ
ncbi:MAG: T9SS type A sorting domain-containing protein, partial [Flavobacteriales bacterium]|nr:T9SS type A sorting domain-containing protein [Flavobacteriales bacterium]